MRFRGGSRSGSADAPLAAALKRALETVDAAAPEPLTGPAILKLEGEPPAPVDERLLYPALHALEADWKIRAEWATDAQGVRHRTYRMRPLLPHHR